MLTFILMVVAGIVLFVVLGVLGWLGTAIDAVFSLLTEGVGNCFGLVYTRCVKENYLSLFHIRVYCLDAVSCGLRLV